MNKKNKTKEELINENEKLHRKISSLEKSLSNLKDQHSHSNELQESESKYRAIFDASPIGIFHFDEKLVVTHCNDKFVKILGSSKERLIGLDMDAKLKDTNILAAVRNALTTGSGYYEDYYTSITSGKITPVRALFSAIYSEDKKIIGGVGLIEDITDRKKTEMELKQSETRFREFADSLPQMVFESDLNGNLTYANKNAYTIMGYTEQDLQNGLNTYEILVSQSVELAKRNFRKSLFEQTQGGAEYYAKKKDGSIIPIEIYSTAIYSEEKLVGLRGIIIDLTERKKVEEAIEKSEEKFFTIFNNAPDGIVYFDIKGKVIEINPAITKITKLTREEVVGYDFFRLVKKLVSVNDLPKVKHAFSQIASGKSVDSFIINYNDKVLEVNVPSKSTKGGVTGIFRDITERKHAEEQILLNLKRQELVLESLPLMFYTGDPNNELSTTWISHQAEEITGFPIERFTSDKLFWTNRLHPDHRERVLEEYFGVLEKGYIKTEYKWLCADGTYQWFVDRVTLTRDENNNPKETIGVWLNISDAKKVQEEVDERNRLNRLRADFWEMASRRNISIDELLNDLLAKVGITFNISRVSFLELDAAGEHFVTRNQWYRPEVGSSMGATIPVKLAKHYYGKNFVDLPKDIKPVIKTFTNTIFKLFNISSYLVVLCGDINNPVSLFTISDCTKNRDWTILEKEVLSELAKIIDTLARQFKFEEALRQSEAKYRDIVTWAPIGIYQSLVDGTFLTVNSSLARILGYSDVDDLMSRSLAKDIYYSSEEIQKLVKEFEKDGKSSVNNLEVVWKKKDGSPIWILLTSHAIKNVKNETIRFEGFVVDISESKHGEAALKESEETLRSFINAIPETAILIDTDMKLLAVNKEMSGYLEKAPHELIGKKIEKIFPEQINTRRVMAIQEVIKTGRPAQFEDERAGKYYMNYFNPVFDSSGKTSKVSIFAFDLTERKMIEKTILQAKEDAEKSSRLKSEFLAQMSHEIRTPINTILSFTSLIESNIHDQLDSELQDGFGIIHSASNRVTRTIDLILNMSEIQTGTYEYSPKEIDLYNDVIVYLLKEFSTVAESKGLKLLFTTTTEFTKIIADEYSITQIFANLIDNAIKYTKAGYVKVELLINEFDQLVAKVSDTGIGISKNYLPQIFEPFTQETQGYSRSFEGNGLGLALVKKYCEFNNAEIFVESALMKGTTFTIIFDNEKFS